MNPDDTTRGTRALRMALQPGYRFAGYEVEAELGRGAFGAVLAGRRLADGQPVAIKILLGPQLRSASSRERLLREAEAARRIEHPNVIRVLEVGEHEGLPYLVMERIEGGALADRLRGLPRNRILEVLRGVAQGLAAAHAAGIVHRDLKPGNVLLRADGSPVVTDFGLAWAGDMGHSLTQSGALLGTPLYMSPEQCRGERPGPAGDVYSWGVLAYEGLVGELPFEAETLVEQLQLVLEKPATLLRDLDPDLPAWLDALVSSCLAKLPEERPSMQAVVERLAVGAPRAPLALKLALASVALGLLAAVAIVLGRPPASPPAAEPVGGAAADAQAPGAQRLVLQPGPLLGRDTYVVESGLYFNDNRGSHTMLHVGERGDQPGRFRAFLEFALERIPAGARIERATLELFPGGHLYGEAPLRLEVYAVADCPPRTPWVEGLGGCDAELDGMAWDADYRGPVRAQLDPAAVASGRLDLTQPDVELVRDLGQGPGGLVCRSEPIAADARDWVALDVTGAVKAWVAGELPNHGLRISCADEGPPYDAGVQLFHSSDHVEAERRPRLTIDYWGSPPARGPDVEALTAARLAAAREALEPLERGQLEGGPQAWTAVRRALEEAPMLGRAYHWRARLLLAEDLVPAARQDFLLAGYCANPERSLEHDQWEVRYLLRAGAREAALDRVGAARLRYPDDPWLAALQAEALAGAKRFDEAGACLQPFLPPRDWRVHEALALLAIHQGSQADAVRAQLARACEALLALPDPLPEIRPLLLYAQLAPQGSPERARALEDLERRALGSPCMVFPTIDALRERGSPEVAQRLLVAALARWPDNRGLLRRR